MRFRSPLRYAAAALVLIALSSSSRALDPEAPGVFVRIVDVGAGHCAIVKVTKDNGWTDYMLFDAGTSPPRGRIAFEEVQRIFHQHDVIQLFVLSHTDSDHIAAVPRICDEYEIRRFLRTGFVRTEAKIPDAWKNAVKAVEKEASDNGAQDINQKVSGDAHGATYAIGDATVTLLSGFGEPPSGWDVSGESKERNSVSIVVRLDFAGRSVLFTGDAVGRKDGASPSAAAIATERYLLEHASQRPLAADVLIAAHHGADNGSSSAFIEAVHPEYVIFPAGAKHGHPRTKTVNRFKKVDSVRELFRTDLGDNKDELTQWSWGRRSFGDKAGDDHVDIHISPNGGIEVEYANPSSHRRPYHVTH